LRKTPLDCAVPVWSNTGTAVAANSETRRGWDTRLLPSAKAYDGVQSKKGHLTMRKWGIVISVFYAVVVLVILFPLVFGPLAGGGWPFASGFMTGLMSFYAGDSIVWIPIAILLPGQALLLFLSVDTSFHKLRPRAHVAVTSAVAGMLLAFLALLAICSIDGALRDDKFGNGYLDTVWKLIAVCGGLWALWGVAFYLYARNSAQAVTRAVAWLLKGSVLELLVAVPCHVIVRRRNDCSAPVVTSFGIVTGIAVMLLSFGPSVLFLFKKRLDEYGERKTSLSGI
jgi:hypothetical protein